MTAALVATFLFLHGLVHLPVWLARAGGDEPFDPRRSWALAAAGLPPARVVSATAVGLASVTAVLYIVAGAATAVQSSGWATAALLAAAVGLVLKAVWFNPWLSLGALLDVGVITAVLTDWPASLY
ncbi:MULTISPECIES: hypothetical protein [Streptomyces]|jgi:hypothetical protein|uniref:hypothetical protein n=1 Tax=Streptomyces TaxID=1883 RepID=UPI001F3E4FDF|nr:hypothetical protein [Streptomyces sp. FB2]MCF2536011.1 hypothetical protein [Streptomyces sp. FB2]